MSIGFEKELYVFYAPVKEKRRRDHPAAVIRLYLKANLPKRPALPQISSIQSRIRSAYRFQFGLYCPAPRLSLSTVFVRLNPLDVAAGRRALRAIGRRKCSFCRCNRISSFPPRSLFILIICKACVNILLYS